VEKRKLISGFKGEVMTYKVSIIVPIYKVEKYLKKCVESLINQTYTNLEIILVNDGSPDNCGLMIDEFARYDSRVFSLHKENGGLSDARNYGMQYVTGDFTVFLDSDDWVAPNFISTLINQSLIHQADVVQSGFYYAYQDFLLYDDRFSSEKDPPLLLDNQSLMRELVINERVKNFAWGKLYKTELVRDLPFKKGVLFEDVFWAHKVMKRVNKYIILNEPMYFYSQRDDSIVSTYSPRNLDILKGLKERHSFIIKHYKQLVDESNRILLKTHLIHYNLLLANRDQDNKGYYRKEIRQFIKSHHKALSVSIQTDKLLKYQLHLFTIHPFLNIAYLFINKVLRKVGALPNPKGLKRINFTSANREDPLNESVS
jgi:glycosyltransferase involved in cell wall biosynthesis